MRRTIALFVALLAGVVVFAPVARSSPNIETSEPDGERWAAAAQPSVITFDIATRGTVYGNLDEFRASALKTLNDWKGWRRGGSEFRHVGSGGHFTLWLAAASSMTSFSSGCSSTWSCRVGRNVIINDDRWRFGSPSWPGALPAYQSMVVNHEVGHWLGLGHASCPGAGHRAPLMMQQSKGLNGCVANPWPLDGEVLAVFGRIVAPPSKAIDVFVRGADNGLWRKPFTGTRWTGWAGLGGVLTSKPAAAAWAPGRRDVFARGTDNALWHLWYNGKSWRGWESLGGKLSDAPAVATTGEGKLDVFVQGTDNALYQKWFNGSRWRGWKRLGGVLNGAPAVASPGSDRLHVFVRGTDNALYQKWFNGSRWSSWERLGGVLNGAPAVASPAPDRLDVFVRGTDNALHHKWWTGTRWSGWERLGGVLNGEPAVSSWGGGRLDVFVRGTNNALWHLWYNGKSWRGWESLGGKLTSSPGAASPS